MATFTLERIGKCPKCHQGNIFEQKGNIFLFRIPKMNERCSECNYRFDKEPGYFFGAMYLSYALAILELFVVFFVTFWLLPLGWFFGCILGVLVLMSFFNYRLSREIWVNLFPY